MEHLLMKAAVTTATDKGEFTAVISAASIDRERDIVDPAGFVRALQKWVPLGKKLPLAWNHSGRPEDQIGYVDPSSVHVQGSEVVASGKMDLESPNGAHAWRCVKAGTLGFSFGYLVPAGGSTKRKGGGRHIHELDVFEVTATPTPMNADTRVLDYKAIKGASTVGPAARHHLEGLIKYYMGKPHPFGACVKDNTKRFGPDGADRVCATLKDIGMGTTHWRNRGKALADAAAAPSMDMPTQDDMDGMCQELYDAAGGDLEQLLEMWFEHQQAMGDVPGKALTPDELRAEAQSLSRSHALRGSHKQTETDAEDEDDPAELLGQMISMAQDFIDDEDEPADVAAMREIMTILLRVQAGEAQEAPDDTAKSVRVDLDDLRRAGEALTLSAVRNTRRKRLDRHDAPDPPAEWIIPEAELAGAKDGELKAVWTTSYVNGLPDSAFLRVEAGGEKDSDGKTVPRSLRMFPYKDAGGQVDKPHLQNALARIPQSDLPQDVKDKLTARARSILDSQKALAVDPVAVDATGQEHHGARSVDPLVQQAHAMAIAWRGHGISRKATPQEPEPRPQFDENALRDEMRALMFTALRT